METALCSSLGKWINKMWYIHIVEYYQSRERNEEVVITCYNMNVPGGYYRNYQTLKSTSYNIIYMKCAE